MYLKKPKASTDPRLRSLLQKAVRRGASSVVERVVRRLLSIGDRTWLRSRAVVITFEEAWPLAKTLEITKEHGSKLTALLRVCRSTKQKDAAGLGALAFAYHEGDKSMEANVPSARDLRMVSEALSRPIDFFAWARTQARNADEAAVVDAAETYLPAATWGWDKATIVAGALLAVSSGIPDLLPAEGADTEFPYWVALDKHTPEGKEALHRIAKTCGARYRHLIWASFYLESATVNALKPSPWFEAEQAWRFGKAGLTADSAKALWARVRSTLQAEISIQADALRALVGDDSVSHADLFGEHR